MQVSVATELGWQYGNLICRFDLPAAKTSELASRAKPAIKTANTLMNLSLKLRGVIIARLWQKSELGHSKIQIRTQGVKCGQYPVKRHCPNLPERVS
jgi:hypothetical protein